MAYVMGAKCVLISKTSLENQVRALAARQRRGLSPQHLSYINLPSSWLLSFKGLEALLVLLASSPSDFLVTFQKSLIPFYCV